MDFDFLSSTPLFHGASAQDLDSMLDCLNAVTKTFSKNETILRAGEPVRSFGMVLSGSVRIESDDVWGNKSILDNLTPGHVFAESYALLPEEPLMVSVIAAEHCEILFLNASRLAQNCSAVCMHHAKLIQNLLSISARKNLSLSQRIFHTSSKTIRGRLLSYLSFQAAQNNSRSFVIPFNRQQLADYLNVDRSALSNELGKMQREGLLKTEKNHFRLI